MAGDFDDPELQIRVTTEADTSGVDSAERSVGGFSDSAHGAAREMRQFTGSTREGEEAVRGVEAAFRGGAAGIGEMIRGLRAMTLIVAHLVEESGPFGILLVILGIIGGAFLSMRGHVEGAGKSLDDAGKKAESFKKLLDETAKAAENSFKGMVDAAKDLVTEMETIERLQKEAEARSKKLEAAQDKVTAARTGLDEAQDLAAAPDYKKDNVRRHYENVRKQQELDKEALDSENGVRQAQAVADSDADLAAAARRNQYDATVGVERAQAAFDEARGHATIANRRSAGSAAEAARQQAIIANLHGPGSEAASIAARVLSERASKQADQDAEVARTADRNAFSAQADLKGKQEALDKINVETDKAQGKADTSADALSDAKQLDQVKQQEIALERQTLAVKQSADAAAYAKEVAETFTKALKDAIKDLDKSDKKADEAADKAEGKQDKADEAAQKAADKAAGSVATRASDNNRSVEAQRQIDKGNTEHLTAAARAAEEANNALHHYIRSGVKMGETARQGATLAAEGVKNSRLIGRQLINEASYNSSP